MVPQNMLRICINEKKELFSEKKMRSDLIKCLKQIKNHSFFALHAHPLLKRPVLLHKCATFSELQSNISTMKQPVLLMVIIVDDNSEHVAHE